MHQQFIAPPQRGCNGIFREIQQEQWGALSGRTESAMQASNKTERHRMLRSFGSGFSTMRTLYTAGSPGKS